MIHSDYKALKLPGTPFLVAVDSEAKVIDSLAGEGSSADRARIAGALGLGLNAALTEGAKIKVNVTATVEIFDEHRDMVSIRPPANGQDESRRFLQLLDVDDQGNIFAAVDDSLVKYASDGTPKQSVALPNDMTGSFCVDSVGYVFVPTRKGISVYSPELAEVRSGAFPPELSTVVAVLRMAFDRKHNCFYMQVYSGEPLFQALYKVDAATLTMKPVFRLESPVRFTPSYSPGAFDFAIGNRYLYISDIRQYKIHLYSLSKGAPVRIYSKPFRGTPIADEDGKLLNHRITMGSLTANGLSTYPPIFHLSFTSKGRLLAWTSQRGREFRQVVDVYDEEIRPIGIALEYIDPGHNGYVFIDGKVVVPDYGFGSAPQFEWLSPLDIPKRPLRIMVFDETMRDIRVK